MNDSPDRPPRLELTPVRMLVTALLVGAVVTWFFTDVIGRLGATPPDVHPVAPVALLLVAIFVFVLGRRLKHRLHEQRKPIDSQEAIRLLVLGKSAALGGAAIVGGYVAFALIHLPRWDAAGPRDRVIWSLIAAVVSIGLMFAGMYLERACKRPDEDDEDDEADGVEPVT